MVLRAPRRADRVPARRLARDRGRPKRADRRAHWLGQDARGLPLGGRPAAPASVAAPRRDGGPLRLAAASAVERRAQEPSGAARRNPRARRRAARGPRGRAHGRHAAGRARRHDEASAAHPHHDARVALPPPDERRRPPHARVGPHGDRRRDSRPLPGQARDPSRAVARASRGARRRAVPAHRPLRDDEAARRGRPLPRRRGPSLPPRRRGHVPRARRGDRSAPVAALDRLLPRAVGGDLRARRRARAGAPDHARLRQHAQDGRAPRRQALGAPRAGCGDEPSR